MKVKLLFVLMFLISIPSTWAKDCSVEEAINILVKTDIETEVVKVRNPLTLFITTYDKDVIMESYITNIISDENTITDVLSHCNISSEKIRKISMVMTEVESKFQGSKYEMYACTHWKNRGQGEHLNWQCNYKKNKGYMDPQNILIFDIIRYFSFKMSLEDTEEYISLNEFETRNGLLRLKKEGIKLYKGFYKNLTL